MLALWFELLSPLTYKTPWPIFSYAVIVSDPDEAFDTYTGVPPVNITVASWVCVAGSPEFCTAVFEDNSEFCVYPISLSALQYNQQANDTDYLTATVTFEYKLYDFATSNASRTTITTS